MCSEHPVQLNFHVLTCLFFEEAIPEVPDSSWKFSCKSSQKFTLVRGGVGLG